MFYTHTCCFLLVVINVKGNSTACLQKGSQWMLKANTEGVTGLVFPEGQGDRRVITQLETLMPAHEDITE